MGRTKVVTPKDVLAESTPLLRDCKDIPFLCVKCDSLLAFVDKETRSEVRVKYRDLYLGAVDPDEFWILCRSCGHRNSLQKEKESETEED